MKITLCEAKIKMTRYILLIISGLITIGMVVATVVKEGFSYIGFSMIYVGVFFVPILLITLIDKYISKKCFLKLTDSGVNGVRKKIFTRSEIDLPIDKIDSILIESGIMDKFEGGKTLLIRSVSGVIQFRWVQNAEAFREAVINMIDEYKNDVSTQTSVRRSSAGRNGSNNTAGKMQELTELFEQGLISRSEYDAKRRELLNKM